MPQLSGELIAQWTLRYANPLDMATGLYTFARKFQQDFSNGNGDDQVNAFWHDTRTLAASATENLDLAGGLTDGFGNVLTFTKIKGIWVVASKDNNAANLVQIGGAAANAFQGPFVATNDKIQLSPGGPFMCVHPKAGWTVTAGTGDILLMANSAGTNPVTYDIALVGVV